MLNEHALFKICIEAPIKLQIEQLNLQFVSVKGHEDPKIELQQKANRMYQMVWSGFTKLLHSLVHTHAKAVQIPGFGIVGPLVEEWVTLRDPLNKGPIERKTFQLKDPHQQRTVMLALQSDFASAFSLELKGSKAVTTFDTQQREELTTLFQSKVVVLNMSKIAQVCLTDSQTVEAMLNEVWAQIQEKSKCSNVSINLKVGSLQINRSLAQFVQAPRLSFNSDASSQVSVMTPSVAQTVGKSICTSKVHPANPNPQDSPNPYRHINKINQEGPRTEQEVKKLKELKFGRKVVFDRQISNQQLFQEHLNIIHQRSQQLQSHTEVQKKERDYIDNRKREDDKREAERQFYNSQIRTDFAKHNKLQHLQTEMKHRSEQQQKINESLDYFPFVSGDLIEQHSKAITMQMRNEINQFMQRHHIRGPAGSRLSNAKSGNQWINSDGVLSQSQTRFSSIQKVTPKVVRTFFDGCYVRPDENPSVIQDSSPAKEHIIKDAALRYHEKQKALQTREKMIESKMQDQVERDKQQARQAELVRKQFQQTMRDTLTSQANAKEKQREIEENKKFGKTSFSGDKDESAEKMHRRYCSLQLQREWQAMIDLKQQQKQQARQEQVAQEITAMRQTQDLQEAENQRRALQKDQDRKAGIELLNQEKPQCNILLP